MAKHIMLTFLSDIKVNGTKPDLRPYLVSKSKFKDIGDTYTTNESAVRFLIKYGWEGKPIVLERIFAFASETVLQGKVKTDNKQFRFPDVAVDEKGDSLTHFSYFRKRIEKLTDVALCLPQFSEEQFFSLRNPVCLYNEDMQDVNATMTSVIGMSSKIQEFFRLVKQENPSEQVILHADMSGGFRHAAMMILSVMRMIQFNGIEIGHVLYSNWGRLDNDDEYSGEGEVQDIREIYGMYDLVSGATEFVNFGSVKFFKQYFETRKQNDTLKDLLVTMEEFDDAIKITKRRTFKNAVINLNEKLERFKHNAGVLKNVSCGSNEKTYETSNLLMLSFADRITREYKDLFEAKDEIVYVEWCLKHDYLQQALTLFTESFPAFVFARHFLSTTEKGAAGLKEWRNSNKERENDPREDEFIMLNEYVPVNYIPVLQLKDKDISSIATIIGNYLKILDTSFKMKSSVKRNPRTSGDSKDERFIDELDKLEKKLEEELNRKYKKGERIYSLYDVDKEQVKNCLAILRKAYVDGFKITLGNLSNDQMFHIRGLVQYSGDNIQTKMKELNRAVKSSSSLTARGLMNKILGNNKIQWESRYGRGSRIEQLLYCKEVECNILSTEELLPVIDEYFYLKAIRNDSVHAKKSLNDVGEYTVSDIRNIMGNTLKEVRRLQAITEKEECRIKKLDIDL